MIDIDSLEIGDKLFYRNGGGMDDLVFVRDWTEEQDPFVQIELHGDLEWVNVSELYAWTGEFDEDDRGHCDIGGEG